MVLCLQCNQRNPSEETYCIACGAALADDSPEAVLSPLACGAVLTDAYVVESSESFESENHYRAVQVNDRERRVWLRERASEDAQLLRRLVEQTDGLAHPAFVTPERFFQQDNRAYLVFPDIPGVRLSARAGMTTEREALAWGEQLCQAIGALHLHGLLCIALPPEGVLLDKEGRVRLTHLETLCKKGRPFTSNVIPDGYAGPEVYKAGMLEETADVFAVGALLFTLVVGKRLPVEGWAVQFAPPVFYPEKVVSPDFERVLRQALAAHPQARYASIEALQSALLALQSCSRTRSAWLTDVGQVRDHNEDAVLVKEESRGTVSENTRVGLYVVADGMGGAEAGEVASALTIQTIARYVEGAWSQERALEVNAPEVCLREAIAAANTTLLSYARQHPESAGLGSTVVAALVYGQQVTLAWVGDSRIYLWEQGRLQQLSRDHSLVARLIEIGQLSPAEARTHEHRNVLLRALGNKEEVTADTVSQPLRRGARLLLCSDGLTGHVADAALEDIVSRHRNPYEAVLELVAAANAGGGSDNISVIVVFHE
jgi:serine/threonine protein phosphatase PrpC